MNKKFFKMIKGLIIIFFSASFVLVLLKYVIKNNLNSKKSNINNSKEQEIELGEPIKVIQVTEGSAKKAFYENINALAPLLDRLVKDKLPTAAINDAIIDINNQELINIWVKINKDPQAIMRILNMWGIRKEDQVEFEGLPQYNDMYDVKGGNSVIEKGYKYKVEKPCWIATNFNMDGKMTTQVINKGVVEKL